MCDALHDHAPVPKQEWCDAPCKHRAEHDVMEGQLALLN